jgi:hypothetical protein
LDVYNYLEVQEPWLLLTSPLGLKIMEYIKNQLIIVLKNIFLPFKSFENISSHAVHPFPLIILFGAMWFEAVRRKWFYHLFQSTNSYLLAKFVVMLEICIIFCILAVLIVLMIKAIKGQISFVCSVNVLGLASLHYSLYLLISWGILMSIPVNTVSSIERSHPNIIPFMLINVYKGAILFSVIRILFGSVISAKEKDA